MPGEQVKEWLCELISGDGFPYGYRKLTVSLRQGDGLIVNHKKVYRLCKDGHSPAPAQDQACAAAAPSPKRDGYRA